MAFLLICVVLAATLLVGLYHLYNRSRSPRCCVPGLRPSNDGQGNMSDMVKCGSLHEFLVQLHRKFGSIASFWFGETFIVSTSGAENFAYQQTLFDRPAVLYTNIARWMGSKSSGVTNGNLGREMLQQFEMALTQEACYSFIPVFLDATEKCVNKFAGFAPGADIPLRENMLDVALTGAMEALFGSFFKDEERLRRFRSAYDVTSVLIDQSLMDESVFSVPQNVDNFEKAMREMREQVALLVERRKKETSSEGRRLVIDEIIDYANGDEQLIFDNAIQFVIASFHTTGTLLTWMIYFIARRVDVQDQLYDELCRTLSSDEIYPAAFQTLTYTKQVIDESLRLSILAPYAARCSDVDLVIAGYVIPKNTPIIQALGVTLYDEKLWPEPQKFDPTRFAPEKARSRSPLSCPFFGFAGKRKCPGYRFSYVEATCFLSVMIRKFRFHLVDPAETIRTRFGLVAQPFGEIWIRVERRIQS